MAWYDRRLDANNLLVDYYATTSIDGGATWEPNVRISDESSAIYLDPNMATCYHGDYDQSVQDVESVFVRWSDDRRMNSGLITDLAVSLVATHPYVGDLRFVLTHVPTYPRTHVPTGTSVTLIDRPGYTGAGFGCASDNIDATFDDEASLPVEDQCASSPALGGLLIPQEELAAFAGEDFAGEWTLNASDNAAGDTGTLEEWCMPPSLMPWLTVWISGQ